MVSGPFCLHQFQAFPLMPLQHERPQPQVRGPGVPPSFKFKADMKLGPVVMLLAMFQVVPVLQPSQLPQQPMTCNDQDQLKLLGKVQTEKKLQDGLIASEGSIGHPELCRLDSESHLLSCCVDTGIGGPLFWSQASMLLLCQGPSLPELV